MIWRLLFCLCCALIFSSPLLAAEILVSAPHTAELEKIYDYYKYNGERGYLMLDNYRYPPLYLQKFPADFAKITDEQRRVSLFIKILAPLAFRLNQSILKERDEITGMMADFSVRKELPEEQNQRLEELAVKYDIFTRLKGWQRTSYLLKELLLRVDTLPPSFLIAAAAIETNWGTSRVVREGNSLYKQLSWYTEEGLKPEGETADDTYRIKTYPDIYSSMQDFALRLNSGVSYAHMREFRRELRLRDSVRRGTTFAYSLLWNSYLSNYAGLLEYTIAFYELNVIDKSALDSKITDKAVPLEFDGYLKKL